jgi:hypothetical protein
MSAVWDKAADQGNGGQLLDRTIEILHLELSPETKVLFESTMSLSLAERKKLVLFTL